MSLAKWVRQSLYLEMTGHTVATLKRFRLDQLENGVHYMPMKEGSTAFIYNHVLIDQLLDKKVAL